jgi:glutamine amidotransferase
LGATKAAFARALSILAPETGPIALAVSGGSDSTALLLLAHEWSGRSGRPLIAATVDHGGAFTAMVVRDNIAGVQFHPEKSQDAGLRLLANFLEWQP